MLFRKRDLGINTINLIGIGALLVFALMFTALVVFEEYRDFEIEVGRLKSSYLRQKKEQIKNQTEKVLRFIAYEYDHYRQKLDKESPKRQILDALEQLYSDLPSNRYIFVYDLNGTNILDPNHPELRGKNLMEVTDPNGFPILPSLIAEAKKGGGFVSYIWEEPASKRFSPKISYAETFEPWGWLVGTGVYMGELEKLVTEKKLAMKSRLIKYVMEILTLSAILFGLAFAGIKLINKVIVDEIETFREFFKEAATRHVVINRSRIRIREFVPLADYVNRMVDTIHRRKKELQELNLSLEEKVRQKTEKLRKEKEFSENLVKTQDAFIKTSIHEINTPLAVITAQVDLLKLRGEGNRYIQKIEAAAKMIHTLYGDLSHLLRRDRVEWPRERIDPVDFVKGRIDFFEEIARANRLTIAFDATRCPAICMNAEEFTRLVDNNLSNAVKYATPHTRIGVALRCEKETIHLHFQNQTSEIEKIEKLFEPFYKERREREGFGLGLHLVRQICEANRIAVTLRHEKNLVTFSYAIPIRECDEDTTA